MQKISAYFKLVPDCSCEVRTFYIDDWYVKPSILSSLAYYLRDYSNGCFSYLCCEKFGCRKFLPEKSKLFPVSCVYFIGPDMVTQNILLVFGK